MSYVSLIDQNLIWKWLKAFREELEHSFPDKGHMKPLKEDEMVKQMKGFIGKENGEVW